MTTETVVVSLPGGWFTENGPRRDACLRPLRGSDELFLAGQPVALCAAARVTALLTRCITSLGGIRPVTREAVQALTVGDREALLLHLRRISFGEGLTCLVRCSLPECGEKLDLELNVGELLTPAYAEVRFHYDDTVSAGDRRYLARYRLPTGADQEAVAALALKDAEQAARVLLNRCLVRLEAVDVPDGAGDAQPPALLSALAEAMAARDPQAELELELHCPACGGVFAAAFDAAHFLFRELAGRSAELYRDVHELALHYHWSERAILALTGQKRRRYLGLLADSARALPS